MTPSKNVPNLVCVAITLPPPILLYPATVCWCLALKACLSKTLLDKGLLQQFPVYQEERYLCTATLVNNKTIGFLAVADFPAGLSAIRAALEASDVLPFSEIGWLSPIDAHWRYYHPAGSTASFSNHIDLFHRWYGLDLDTSRAFTCQAPRRSPGRPDPASLAQTARPVRSTAARLFKALCRAIARLLRKMLPPSL